MVYEIRTYSMIGATLYTKKERPDLYEKNGKFYIVGTNTEAYKSQLWKYTTILDNKITYFNADDEFLPYFADVTEDLPRWGKKLLTPKTYNNCQLMVEKHGGYYQFKHSESGEVLRIAINSHYYTPIK